MGCDIHVFVEYKLGGAWHCLGQPRRNRIYHLFGLLSGVRTDEDSAKQFFPNRQRLPSGVTEDVREAYEGWGGDAHSLTVVPSLKSLKAFLEYVRKHDSEEKYASRTVEDWYSLCKSCVRVLHADEVRLVCWYDN